MRWTRHVFDDEVMIGAVCHPGKKLVVLDQKFVDSQLTSLLLVFFLYQVRQKRPSVGGPEY